MSSSTLLRLLAVLPLVSCSSNTERLGLPPLQTVPKVELSRYLGTWFEIASIPQSFQRGCTGTQATYSLRSDGDIEVVNRCRKNSLAGVEEVATGRARVTDRATNAKLEVSFFGPFWGPYWVIQLGDDYDYAVVGNPDRDSLWILSRTPVMDPLLYSVIITRLEAEKYPLDLLALTTQPQE
jgi:apolipoprotein D and lipocalin family protein